MCLCACTCNLSHRSLAQLLLVLDDADLHQRQTPFSLGGSRAIASTLNSLVFHTAFPEAAAAGGGSGTQQRQQPGQQLGQQGCAIVLPQLAVQVMPVTLAQGLVSEEVGYPTCLQCAWASCWFVAIS